MKLGKKTILIAGLPIGLAAAGALAFVVLSGSSAPVPEVRDPAAGEHGVMLALDDKVVNLLPAGPTSYRYVKVGVTIELRPATADFYKMAAEARVTAEEAATKGYSEDLPLLLDSLGRVVSARTSDQVATPAARAELKSELLDAFRSVLGEKEVLDLYFTELVMQ
jgi:flagellar basal body-associated protein FliL